METGTEVLFVFPANHAELSNGLAYINGGGWTTLYRQVRPDGEQPIQFGIVVALLVPWLELGRPHGVTINIKPDPSLSAASESDADSVTATVTAQVFIGGQVSTREGKSEHIMLTLSMSVLFPATGLYLLTADVNESGKVKDWQFWVEDVVAPRAPGPR